MSDRLILAILALVLAIFSGISGPSAALDCSSFAGTRDNRSRGAMTLRPTVIAVAPAGAPRCAVSARTTTLSDSYPCSAALIDGLYEKAQ
jgi:hypothetical protein